MQDRIGPFEVVRELGRGGMGVVYLARDTRLDREVAIKVLPEHLAADPGRLERFEREAKTLAGLSHPNVAGIHGVEEQGGAKYLVLEFVDGETLADRLDRGPLPVDEAVEYAGQIALGLEAAHDAGIVHRDLKPGNIIITPEGRATVLDFGLARVDEGGQSSSGVLDSPTLTAAKPQHSPTIAGAIMGTAAYMSPEQARGRRVDKRTDVWSFGVVLYEMLAGAGPFHGETATDSIGAVLHKDPDFALLPSDVPGSVRRVLERCLERDRARRYRDIGDARLDLERGDEDDRSPGAAAGGLPFAAVAVAMLALLAAGLAGGRFLLAPAPPEPEPPTPVAFQFPFGWLHGASDIPAVFAISPTDRSIIAWAGRLPDDPDDALEAVCVHDLRTGLSRRLRGTEDAETVEFSPDGSQIVFYYDPTGSGGNEFRRVSVDGGPVVTVVADPDNTPASFFQHFCLWTEDDHLLLATPGPFTLHRVSIDTGAVEPIGAVGGTEMVYAAGKPSLINPTTIVFPTVSPTGGMTFAVDLTTLEATELIPDGGIARPIDGGRLVYAQNETLFSAPFDAATLAFTGPRTPVLTGLASSVSWTVSEAGDLLAVRGGAVGPDRGRQLYLMGRDGEGRPAVAARRLFTGNVVPLAEGSVLAVSVFDTTNDDSIGGYLVDRVTGAIEQLPPDGGIGRFSDSVTPDGRLVVTHLFRPDHYELEIRSPDGTFETVLPEPDDLGEQRGLDVSPDGRWGLFEYLPRRDGRDDGIYMVDLALPVEQREAIPVFASPSYEGGVRFSPDGSWIAYSTDASGRREIVARPFDPENPAARTRAVLVSTDGAGRLAWSPEGDELFFDRFRFPDGERGLFSVAVTDTPDGGKSFSAPELILSAVQLQMHRNFGYSIWSYLPREDAFVFVRNNDSDADIRYDYVRHWTSTLPVAGE